MKLDMGLTQIFVSYDYSIITRQDKPDRLLARRFIKPMRKRLHAFSV